MIYLRPVMALMRRRYGRPRRRIVSGWQPPHAGAIDVALTSDTGYTLRGWYLPCDQAPASGPAALVMHGWGGSAQEMSPLSGFLLAAGFNVLLLDARCHGRSDPDEMTSMPAIADDIAVGLRWLRGRADVDRSRVVLIGHSVGGGACLLVASRDEEVAAVVSIASMAHPGEFMASKISRRLPRPLVGLALGLVERAIGEPFDDFAPVETIKRVRKPVMLVHGDSDRTVPFEDASKLLHASGGRARLVVVAGGDHTGIGMLEQAGPGLTDFLSQAV